MKDRLNRNAGMLALVAVVIAVMALLGGAAMATQHLITGKQIRNNSITTKDLKNNGVTSTDIENGGVDSADIENEAVTGGDLENGTIKSEDLGSGQVHSQNIGSNQVTPADVEMPEAQQMVETTASAGSATVGPEFALLDPVGSYDKEVSESKLEVTWNGTVEAGGLVARCVFQLRVDGKPGQTGAGEIFSASAAPISISTSALWSELPAGKHSVEVWAKSLSTESVCTVGPGAIGIDQTFTVNELVE